jgi:hypothetical protein
MLVTIAAAALALASADRAAPQPGADLLEPRPPRVACKAAGRLQVSYAPALLYRPAPGDRAKKLVEMPVAQACLLGARR